MVGENAIPDNVISLIIFVGAMLVFVGLAALIPYLLNSIGLGRVCKMLGACSPVLAYIPILNYVALAKASNAADRHNGTKRKGNIVLYMVLTTLLCVLFGVLFVGAFIATAIFMNVPFEGAEVAVELLQTLVLSSYLAFMLVTYCVFLLRTVVCYFCYWRILNAFKPAPLKFIMLGVMVLYAQFSCIVMFILPFFDLKEPAEIGGRNA